MCAVVESAVLREVKDILKVACQLFGLDVESSKPLNAWSVDKVATLWQQKHFAKGSGVHACVVSIGYRRSAQAIRLLLLTNSQTSTSYRWASLLRRMER